MASLETIPDSDAGSTPPSGDEDGVAPGTGPSTVIWVQLLPSVVRYMPTTPSAQPWVHWADCFFRIPRHPGPLTTVTALRPR